MLSDHVTALTGTCVNKLVAGVGKLKVVVDVVSLIGMKFKIPSMGFVSKKV